MRATKSTSISRSHPSYKSKVPNYKQIQIQIFVGQTFVTIKQKQMRFEHAGALSCRGIMRGPWSPEDQYVPESRNNLQILVDSA